MPVAGFTTGVDVDPMSGVRSEQPMVDAANGVPNERVHLMAPVVALMPYAFACSVVMITVPFSISGCEYTDPDTLVENSLVKLADCTTDGTQPRLVGVPVVAQVVVAGGGDRRRSACLGDHDGRGHRGHGHDASRHCCYYMPVVARRLRVSPPGWSSHQNPIRSVGNGPYGAVIGLAEAVACDCDGCTIRRGRHLRAPWTRRMRGLTLLARPDFVIIPTPHFGSVRAHDMCTSNPIDGEQLSHNGCAPFG